MRMAIVGYSAGNYRAFGERTNIDFRPLTLLFGYNSAGKSALLRALPLLRDSALGMQSEPIALLSPAARGASFGDILSRFSNSPALSFELRWDDGEIRAVEYVIRDLPDRRRQIVEKLTLFGSRRERLLAAEWIPQEEKGAVSTRYKIFSIFQHDLEIDLRFRGLKPQFDAFESSAFAADLFIVLESLLDSFGDDVNWLHALRALPPRREVFTGVPNRVDPDGKGITQLLFYDDLVGGSVIEEVSKWYQSATKHRLDVRRGSFAGKELFSVVLSPIAGSSVEVELVDTGEGMGQVLPVIGLLALAKHHQLGKAPILAIEHPELHLHPSAHAALAELFCSVAAEKQRPATIIVETHSESFLLSVQLAIVNQKLASDKVAVYWVRQSDDGAALIDRIEFDDFGRPKGDNWPPGVFSENVEQSRNLLLARRARGKE
jgi:AAA ATPase domain